MKRKPTTPAAHAMPHLRSRPLFLGADLEETVLDDEQRKELVRIGTRLSYPARALVYREHSDAQWVFAIADGAVKSYRELPSGKCVVNTFLFARDLFGLAENGRYVNSVRTITSVTLYRLPLRELAVLLKQDGDMQFKFLSKVTHELRESQRRAIVLTRPDRLGRLAMFISWMSTRFPQSNTDGEVVTLPMTRTDIAAFLGLALESVTRAAAELERRGLVKFEGRHRVCVLDRPGLNRLLAEV